MNLGKRIEAERKIRGWTQIDLIQRVPGLQQQTLDRLEKRDSKSSSFTLAIASAFGLTVEQLLGSAPHPTSLGLGSPVAALPVDALPSDDYVQIRESEVHFAAGNGRQALFDEQMDSAPATYRRDWFVREGINPEHARRFKVSGSSMEPLLHPGDTVLVHLAETTIISGRVYALRYGDELRIKRVYRQLDGSLILHSDNPDHVPRDETVPPAVVADQIAIIGRVRDKAGPGGL